MSVRSFAFIVGGGVLLAYGIAVNSSSSPKPVRLVIAERVTAVASLDPNLRPELFVVAQIDKKFTNDWKVERLFAYDDESGEQVQTVLEVPSEANNFCKEGPMYAIPHADPAKSYRLEYVLWPTGPNVPTWSENSELFRVETWTEYVDKGLPRNSDSVANAAKPARS